MRCSYTNPGERLVVHINYINPSISTRLEYNIDWQKTFHLHHFPPVFSRILREAKPLREMMKQLLVPLQY